MSRNNSEFLWYIPNQTNPGHRGDAAVESHNSLDTLTSHAKALEDHGWKGALIGAGWGRPDTFTVATASPPEPRRLSRSSRSARAIGGRHILHPPPPHWII
jgi:hypothetical protein